MLLQPCDEVSFVAGDGETALRELLLQIRDFELRVVRHGESSSAMRVSGSLSRRRQLSRQRWTVRWGGLMLMLMMVDLALGLLPYSHPGHGIPRWRCDALESIKRDRASTDRELRILILNPISVSNVFPSSKSIVRILHLYLK